MANPAPTINQINAFNATQGTTIDFNIIGGTELVRSNRIYIYDLSDNSLICTHLYVSTESIHELPANTDSSIIYESGKSSADFVNGAQYYAQIQTYTDVGGTQGGSGLSVAKMFWCLVDPTLTITTIPSTISTTSYNVSATYNANTSVVSNIIQQYQFSLYSAVGSLLQSSGVVVGSGEQQGTSASYNISYNFTGLSVGSSYYVVVDVTTTQGMSVSAQSNTFTVSIDTPTLGEATVVNNACDGYISVTSNLSGEYGGSASGEIVSFETDSENVFTKLQVDLDPIQSGSGTPSPSNVRPISGHAECVTEVCGVNVFGGEAFANGIKTAIPQAVLDTDAKTISYASGYAPAGTKFTNGIPFKENTQYTIILKFSNTKARTNMQVVYTDGTTKFIPTSVTGLQTIVFTSATNKTIDYIGGLSSDRTSVFYYEECGVFEGVLTADQFEPYNGQTYTKDIEATYTPTVQENEPYQFKRTGDVGGDRESIELVGGTVAWNQLLQTLDTFSTESGVTKTYSDGIATITSTIARNGIYAPLNYQTGHKYLFVCDLKATSAYSVVLGATSAAFINKTVTGDNQWHTIAGISNSSTSGNKNAYIYATITYENLQAKNYNVIDLTAEFGTTIADYIYSLEQATEGAGVAWFRNYFPKDYYPYDPGTLRSVEGVSAHETVGFNQWDEEWEVGTISTTTGQNASNNTLIRSTNYIHCAPDTQYYPKAPSGTGGNILFYDADKNYISYVGMAVNYAFTTPSNAHYMRFRMGNVYGTTYNHDICINLSDPSRNGEYEPYQKHTYPLDSDLTLMGIPKLDASNNLYYDGDTYESDGTVTRKYGIVDLGTLNWNYDVSVPRFYSGDLQNVIKKASSAMEVPNALCPIYQAVTFNWIYGEGNDKGITVGQGGSISVKNTAYTDAATFKTAMSGVYLVYELATPTTETAEPFESIQKVTPNYGTEEFVTDSIVPVGNNTQYYTRDIYGGTLDLVSGVLTVDRAMVDLGTLNWNVYNGKFTSVLNPEPLRKPFGAINMLCSIYKTGTYGGSGSQGDGTVWLSASTSNNTLYVEDSRYTDATAFKTAMSGQTLVYELATPTTYQLTPQQVQTLVGVNNVWSEQGDIELSYHIPITNLLVKRQDVDDVSGNWLTLYSQPVEQASDMDFTFIDFLNQYGKTYKYALVPLLTQTQSGVEVEVEGGYTVSDEVQSVFDGVFISDSTGSQKCKANVGYGNVDMNQVVGSITPIGAKYPIVITNSQNQYHNGSISGTIVPDDYYFNGNLSRIDMVNKRSELEQFLTNKRAKIIKDWNGNIWLVMIMDNVSCTFNNNYGMGIVNFSTNWVEVGDPTSQQDLQATGLIDVGGV